MGAQSLLLPVHETLSCALYSLFWVPTSISIQLFCHGLSSNQGCHMQSVRLQRQNKRLFQVPGRAQYSASPVMLAQNSCYSFVSNHLRPAPLLPQLMLLSLPVDTLEASHTLRSHPKASVYRARGPLHATLWALPEPRYGPWNRRRRAPSIIYFNFAAPWCHI